MAGIFIFGGCVTRDTFEQLKAEHTLTDYIARQSLISAASPPTNLEGHVEGKGFRYKCVMGDLKSTLHDALRNAADSTDLVVVDLLVERLGVLALPDGSYVTRSQGMRKSGAIEHLWGDLPFIKMGTAEHFRLWIAAVDELIDVLRETGLIDRTLLIDTPWASSMEDGSPTKKVSGWTAEHAAKVFEPYYQALRDRGIKTARIPDELVVSALVHNWGQEPYHYTPGAYDWMRDQIVDSLPLGQ